MPTSSSNQIFKIGNPDSDRPSSQSPFDSSSDSKKSTTDKFKTLFEPRSFSSSSSVESKNRSKASSLEFPSLNHSSSKESLATKEEVVKVSGENISTSSLLTLLSKTASSISSFSNSSQAKVLPGSMLQLIDEHQHFKMMFVPKRQKAFSLVNGVVGIWLSKATNAPFLILDVEGTDGRERGENQAALFSLAIAQVVIINMWEYSIGLYNAANMVLLKTVLEVHAQLFQSSNKPLGSSNTNGDYRTTLLFVIRDYIGNTPFEQLKSIILKDLENIWSSLSFASNRLEDHFIISFASLPHKLLKADEFTRQVKELSRRFYERESTHVNPNPIFPKGSASNNVPLDGFPSYAASIWERIRSNKDLDLPTQQQLLAQFRCSELSQVAMDRLESSLNSISISPGQLHPNIGATLDRLIVAVDTEFLGSAQRYHAGTVEKQRLELLERAIVAVRPLVTEQLRTAAKRALLIFVGGVEAASRASITEQDNANFAKQLDENRHKALAFFDEKSKGILPGVSPDCDIGVDWALDEVRQELIGMIGERASFYRREEVQKALADVTEMFQKALHRRLSSLMDDAALGKLLSEKNTTATGIWEAMFRLYQRLISDAQRTLATRTSSICSKVAEKGSPLELASEEIERKLLRACWEGLLSQLRDDAVMGSLVLARLKRRFDTVFRYDDSEGEGHARGAPRLWAPGQDISKPYNDAIEKTLAFLDDLAELTGVPTGAAWLPSTAQDHILLMSTEQRSLAKEAFLRDAELAFIEATRSALSQPRTQIPTWLWVLLVVLGWNEFMAVLGSPVYFILVLAIALIAFFYFGTRQSGMVLSSITGLLTALIARALEMAQNLLTPPAPPEPHRAAGGELKAAGNRRRFDTDRVSFSHE